MEYSKSIVGFTPKKQITEKSPLNDFERDLVIYFFAKLKLTDPRFYIQAMPDEKTEKITKREFSESIRFLTKEKIDCGFAELHQLISSNHADYKFLTIPKVIGVCSGSASEGNPVGAHRYFEPLALPDKTAQEKARSVGACEIDRLMGMFKAEPKKTTDNDMKDLLKLERIKHDLYAKT